MSFCKCSIRFRSGLDSRESQLDYILTNPEQYLFKER